MESITYFPTNPNATFLEAKTVLQYNGRKQKGYEITLRTFSNFEKQAYLRQDVTFIFANGRLIDKENHWKRDVRQLAFEGNIPFDQNALFQAVTFHHAEIHAPKEGISSVQTGSMDDLYVIGTESPALNFREAETEEEFGWKEIMDKKTSEILETSKQSAVEADYFHPEFYDAIPLTELFPFMTQPLPSFSMEETKRIIGQLMEGLYKNYFLGIKKRDGTTVSPIGSTVPIIWIAKNKMDLFITFETADGQPIVLRQNIGTKHSGK